MTAVDDLVRKTLSDLEKQEPQSKDEIAQSIGYVVMSTKMTKIPLLGAGSGFGAAVETESGEKTYLRMRRFDIGAGWGARSVRPVLIFSDEKKFDEFRDGSLKLTIGTEASAKVGEKGAAGGAGAQSSQEGYVGYLITDAGVSATASLAVIRVKPVRLKE